MVGLLGMLGAGAAMGARDASNATVKAMNEMEIRQGQNNMEMDREKLRQYYLDKRYGQERQDSKEMFDKKIQLEDKTYHRNKEDKLANDELNHNRRMSILDKTESGQNSRNNARIAAMKERSASSGGSSGKSGNSSIQLEDGTIFTPNDADSKNAANLVQLRLAKDMRDAYIKIHASKYTSAAASSLNGMREGAVGESLSMSSKLFGGNGQQPNAATGGDVTYQLDPKTGKLILGK